MKLVGFNRLHYCENLDFTLNVSKPSVFFFIRFYLFIFRDRGREGERGREIQCVVASHVPPPGDQACNATQACALNDPLLRSLVLNPLRLTNQG